MNTIEVYFPFGGEYYLLHWWCHEEQGNIILSKNKKSLEKVFDTVLKKYGTDIKIFSFQKIEIVAPYEELAIERNKWLHEQEVNNFYYSFSSFVSSVFPEKNISCSFYETCKKCNGDNYQCSDCIYGLKWKISQEELYIKFSSLYEEIFQTKVSYHYHDDALHASLARCASKNEQLFYVEPNFGHHRKGLEIHCIDSDNLVEDYIVYKNPLFFFLPQEEFDYSYLIDKINFKIKEQSLYFDKQKILLEKKKKKDKEDSLQKLLLLFGENASPPSKSS